MSRSLSNPTDSFFAPNDKEMQPVILIEERDQTWHEGLTQDEYEYYYRQAWNRAYLMVGHQDEADVIADKAIDALRINERPPSKKEIEAYLRVLVTSRALDCLRSPMHRFRDKCQSLLRKNDDDNEYDAIPQSHSCIGAEEEFFYEGDRELFAKQLAQATSRLNDLQRTCFVLRFVEHMKPDEIAKMLNIPVDKVHTQTYRARNRIAKLLSHIKKEEGGIPSE